MSSKFSSAFVVTVLLSHTVLAPLTAVAQEQDTSAQQTQQVQEATDSNKSVSTDSPEASKNVSQDSTTQGNSQTQTENIEGAGPTHGGEMSDKSKLDDDGQMKEVESDSATDASSKESIEPIDTWMPDKKLQTAVSETLGISVPNITKKDMLSLKRLDISAKGISNITGLEYASNVTSIHLNYNQISDITPLQNLTSLDVLDLGSNQISDITPLQNLTSLTGLHLNYNQISDITPLQNLTSLDVLDLGSNQISDITPLQNLTSLTGLYLNSNQISDITPLQNLTSLTGLYLGFNQISDITPLQNLTSLIDLYLGFNQISDISSLAQLTAAIFADGQVVVLPEVYVHNRKPYSISIESPIKGYSGLVPLSPQNDGTWTGVYNSGKVEWSGGDQVLEKGELSSTWGIQDGNRSFSGTYTQPYILSKATITAHNSTVYVGDNWNPIDNFDSALDHEGNPLDFSKITVRGTVDTSRPGVYPIVYGYEGLEEKVEVTVKERKVELSVPTTVDFGSHVRSIGEKNYGATVSGDPLKVYDERGNAYSWKVSAKLTNELANESGDQILNALHYQTGNDDKIFSSSSAIDIASGKGTKDISASWSDSEGLLLKVDSSKYKTGKYSSTIEWTLNDAP